MRGWLESALDFLFPPRCTGCGKRGIWLCDSCRSSLPYLPTQVCRNCGQPLTGVAVCADCYQHAPPFGALRSACYFEGTVREMIHRLKYRGASHLAAPLAQLAIPLAEQFSGLSADRHSGDLVIAVPLFPARQAERGYNQSALLARQIAVALGWELGDQALSRVRDTPAQIGLPREARLKNVRGAFAAAGPLVKGRHVLLVDDVCTTGATIRACATALRQAGAGTVNAVTIARARWPDQAPDQ